ncbi:MAG TPA: alpha/beta hydrolase [Thermoleophilaceae bacterium]|nr:alpha/beta hydrolase [Thermoleophilaceae bacterium]
MHDDSGNGMNRRRLIVKGLAAGVAAALTSGAGKVGAVESLRAARVFKGGIRNVVLVHGAYADGSSWSDVIERLQAAGVTATAVQNPLSSLADDVAATRLILAQHAEPTILVGHSYGGTVITEAGADAHVAGLVYVAARAPDAGEDYAALTKTFPSPPANAGLVYEDGFGRLTERAFLHDFANGVDRRRARVLYAVQGHISATLFSDRTTVAAWRSKPCWYAVSKRDRTTSPELERFLARRMKAKTIELDSGHLSLITHPRQITELILRAARHSG